MAGNNLSTSKKLGQMHHKCAEKERELKLKNLQLLEKERELKKIKSVQQKKENYKGHCDCSTKNENGQATGRPLTSHITSSFEMAKKERSPYDKFFLNLYNTRSLNHNYNLQ